MTDPAYYASLGMRKYKPYTSYDNQIKELEDIVGMYDDYRRSPQDGTLQILTESIEAYEDKYKRILPVIL